MNSDERKRARLERFRSSLIQRARGMTARLLARVHGGGATGDEQEVARELHTLKGDANMLGLLEIAEIAHAAETLLIVNGQVRVDGPRIVEALDQVIGALEGHLGDEPKTAEALRAQVAALSEVKEYAAPEPQAAQNADFEAAGQAPVQSQSRSVSVEVEPLDDVCEGLADVVFEVRGLHHRAHHEAVIARGEERRGALERLESLDRLASRLEQLRDSSWRLLLQPVESLLQDLARHARELAQTQGKRLRTVVRCASVQLERSACDRLWDALLHLVRNAVAHGVETPDRRGTKDAEALLVLSAEPVGPNIVIEVYDDGSGVDTTQVRSVAVARGLMSAEQAVAIDERAALDLIFAHGFSTRETADAISGRGIGLDVVRYEVERLGGSVRVVSDLGQGTRFLLELPARVGKERALVIDCGAGPTGASGSSALYGVPSRSVREIIKLPEVVSNQLRHGVDTLPYSPISEILSTRAGTCPFGLILEVQNRRWVLGVTTLLGEYELVRRPVDDLLGGSGLVGAAALLADGRHVLILTPSELARRTGAEGGLATPMSFLAQEPASELGESTRGDA